MRLVSVEAAGGEADGDALPLEYDPARIEEYWGRRPVAVATRILQVGPEGWGGAWVGGCFVGSLGGGGEGER